MPLNRVDNALRYSVVLPHDTFTQKYHDAMAALHALAVEKVAIYNSFEAKDTEFLGIKPCFGPATATGSSCSCTPHSRSTSRTASMTCASRSASLPMRTGAGRDISRQALPAALPILLVTDITS